MFSAYLNKEINLRVAYATGCGGVKHPIVYHSELESFILALAGDIRYDYTNVIPSSEDAVVTCAMWDSKDYRVVALGEATPDTLTSDVSKAYPTTTAANRAFDRAAIRFLRLCENGCGAVYSNLEMAPDGPKNYDSQNLTDAPGNNVIIPDNTPCDTDTPPESIPQNGTAPQAPAESSQPKATTPPVAKTPEPVPTAQPVEASSAVGSVDGAVLVTMGKYKAKPTPVSEIYKNDESWFRYIANSLTPKQDVFKAQVEAMRRYARTQEGA